MWSFQSQKKMGPNRVVIVSASTNNHLCIIVAGLSCLHKNTSVGMSITVCRITTYIHWLKVVFFLHFLLGFLLSPRISRGVTKIGDSW